MAAIAVSIICVPAGPSKRAQPSRTPGNRSTLVFVSLFVTAPVWSMASRDLARLSQSNAAGAGPGRYPDRVRDVDDKLPIKMVADRLLVKIPEGDAERRSQGGILIPATAQMAKRLVWAEVVALGPNVRSAETGDQVLFSPEDRYEVEVQGIDYIMLRERDLHAVAAKRIEASTGLYL